MGNFLNDLSDAAVGIVQLFSYFKNTIWVYPVVLFIMVSTFFLIFTSNK